MASGVCERVNPIEEFVLDSQDKNSRVMIDYINHYLVSNKFNSIQCYL